jgi:hypothetical protein
MVHKEWLLNRDIFQSNLDRFGGRFFRKSFTNPFGGEYLDGFMPRSAGRLYHRLNQFHGEQG